MKKRRALYSLALICILSACLLTWWFTPVLALQTACDQITAVEVTNQITGNRFVLRSPQTVTHITQNLSTHKVVRSRLANASDRSVYQLVFLDQRGNEREMLYLNHAGSLRRGNLFIMTAAAVSASTTSQTWSPLCSVRLSQPASAMTSQRPGSWSIIRSKKSPHTLGRFLFYLRCSGWMILSFIRRVWYNDKTILQRS